MVEIRIEISERQLARMDRMLRREDVRGSQWLKDAVSIYKAILADRRARFQRPVPAGRSRTRGEGRGSLLMEEAR